MDKKYMEECTSGWEIVKGNGVVEVWEYFDKVEYKTKYAVKVYGEVKSIFSESDANPYRVYDIIEPCF